MPTPRDVTVLGIALDFCDTLAIDVVAGGERDADIDAPISRDVGEHHQLHGFYLPPPTGEKLLAL